MVELEPGVWVSEEWHGIMGQPGSYRRYKVRCPLSTSAHKCKSGCQKTRTWGSAQKRPGDLGQYEPLAYLGAWLDMRDSYSTQRDHVAFQPSAEQTRAYAQRQGWVSAGASSSAEPPPTSDLP